MLVVVIGHAEGADLAKVVLAHGQLVTACILLRPKRNLIPAPSERLHGLRMLLGRLPGEDELASDMSSMHGVTLAASAELTGEQVSWR